VANEPNGQTSSHDVRKEDGKDDVTLVDTPAKGCSLRYQPTSLSVPVPAIVENGTTKPEPPRRAEAAMRETKGLKQGQLRSGRWAANKVAAVGIAPPSLTRARDHNESGERGLPPLSEPSRPKGTSWITRR
jgi:hypothetical protein